MAVQYCLDLVQVFVIKRKWRHGVDALQQQGSLGWIFPNH
jgi:hypothetical protein